MFSPDQYALLDFGLGRRLERIGGLVLDRPAPAVESVPRSAGEAWARADARFVRTGSGEAGVWERARDLPERWTVSAGPLTLELKRTEFGHLGFFPEHAAHWDWIARQVACAGRPLRVLNLFGYTGGSTLAAAAAGAEVTHIDAARNVVAWARRNAQLSGLADAPIRWIAEDALKFVRREIRRGRTYDAVVLDPPSYGHGPHGEVWRLDKALPALLDGCAQLTFAGRTFILLTCHTPDYGPARLAELLASALSGGPPGRLNADCLAVRTSTGRELPCGVSVRWELGGGGREAGREGGSETAFPPSLFPPPASRSPPGAS